MNILRRFAWLAVVVLTTTPLWGDEPNALNPFDDKPATPKGAVLGYVELSDGSIHPGEVSLTRDKRLQLADDKTQQQRGAPVGREADRLRRKEGVDGEGVAFQGDDQQREVLHRSQVSVARVHAHDHVSERPQGRRRPVGRRLPSTAGIHTGRDANGRRPARGSDTS